MTASGMVDVVDIQCLMLTTLWVATGSQGDFPSCLADVPETADLSCDHAVTVVDVMYAIKLALGDPLSPEVDADGDLVARAELRAAHAVARLRD